MKKILLSLTICLSVNAVAYCLYPMNKGDIRTSVRKAVSDTASNPSLYRWSDTELDKMINYVQDDFVYRTQGSEGRYYITTTSNIAEYAMPSNLIKVKRVSYHIANTTNTFKRIIQLTRKGLDKDDYWENRSAGDPMNYYLRASTSSYWIGLVPKPGSAYAGTNYLAVDYMINVSSMTEDTDYPFNSDQRMNTYHVSIVWGVSALCSAETRNTDMRDYFQNKYDFNIALAKDTAWGIWSEPDYDPNFR